VLAALYARRRTGTGQRVAASLLGAALTLKSGAFIEGGTVRGGPVLDADQAGYGAAYRLYRCQDDAWIALAIGCQEAWHRLRATVSLPALPATPSPLRHDGDSRPHPEELLLEAAFRTRPAAEWVRALRAAGVPVEPAAELDRTAFAAGFTADPVLVQRGRVVSYEWDSHGRTRQPSFPPALGPAPRPPAMRGIAGLGETARSFCAELSL
jgi:crotonobetainyl-CoA:carnitine CoA-transferase CaiB-like acyl-CoA transferase